jgi:vacuolar-type H+-ATPase subunit D/Vma8
MSNKKGVLKKTFFRTSRKCKVEKKFKNVLNVSVILIDVSNQEQTYVEIKEDNLLAGEQQALKRWSEYFKDLLCNFHEETAIDEEICYIIIWCMMLLERLRTTEHQVMTV